MQASSDDAPAPRYSAQPFPPYRYRPGRTPHPTRDPRGHGFGREPESPAALHPERWAECDAYLHGVDLFNAGYWWESHEVLEALWHAAGHDTPTGRLLRALIQLAASELKREVGAPRAARSLARKALRGIEPLEGAPLGIEVDDLARHVRARAEGTETQPLRIRLRLPGMVFTSRLLYL